MTVRTPTPPGPRLGRAGRGRRLLRAVAYGAAFAVPVGLLALVVREKFAPLLDLDALAIRHATDVTRAHPTLRTALVGWQEAFQPWRVYVVGTGACLWLWLARGHKTRAWWCFATMMVTWNLALDLKLLVERARPTVADPVSTAPGWSFPSGHAANTAGAVTCLVIALWPVLRPAGRRAAVAVGGLVVILTALDRVFLGVHYPTDVCAGVLVGCGIAVASYAGYVGWSPLDPDADPTPPDTTVDAALDTLDTPVRADGA